LVAAWAGEVGEIFNSRNAADFLRSSIVVRAEEGSQRGSRSAAQSFHVIPAKAGIHLSGGTLPEREPDPLPSAILGTVLAAPWIPAFAGMTSASARCYHRFDKARDRWG
jgi:hypothetical protein